MNAMRANPFRCSCSSSRRVRNTQERGERREESGERREERRERREERERREQKERGEREEREMREQKEKGGGERGERYEGRGSGSGALVDEARVPEEEAAARDAELDGLLFPARALGRQPVLRGAARAAEHPASLPQLLLRKLIPVMMRARDSHKRRAVV
eukprot:426252-Rhodomonas_salina.1